MNSSFPYPKLFKLLPIKPYMKNNSGRYSAVPISERLSIDQIVGNLQMPNVDFSRRCEQLTKNSWGFHCPNVRRNWSYILGKHL